jgi:hypothetical protein
MEGGLGQQKCKNETKLGSFSSDFFQIIILLFSMLLFFL